MTDLKTGIDTFNPQFREEEGRLIPRRQLMRRKDDPQPGIEPKQARDSTKSGLQEDSGGKENKQDTPGRPKSASSRQQTQPEQATQSGSVKLDSE